MHHSRDPNKTKSTNSDAGRQKISKSGINSRALVIRIVEVLRKQFVHCEHVNLLLLENSPQRVVAADPAFVSWVLKVIGVNVCPNPLDRLRSRKLVHD